MKKKVNWSNVILVMIFLLGLSLLLYPSISDYWNSFHQSRAIVKYSETVANMDNDKYIQELEDAKEYNKRLTNKTYQWKMTENEIDEYNSLLNITDSGIMGYIEIPNLNTTLPIYHGTEEKVLQVAVGHIEGSSLPVGGESTHSVISGHRGLPSAKLFTDLDELEVGDIFMFHVLDDTLTYEVDQIRIVLPDKVNDIEIVEGEDYSTLITCTPYGINSHRLLVRGHRVENPEHLQAQRVPADATIVADFKVAIFIGISIIIILISWLFIKSWYRGLKNNMKKGRVNGNEKNSL